MGTPPLRAGLCSLLLRLWGRKEGAPARGCLLSCVRNAKPGGDLVRLLAARVQGSWMNFPKLILDPCPCPRHLELGLSGASFCPGLHPPSSLNHASSLGAAKLPPLALKSTPAYSPPQAVPLGMSRPWSSFPSPGTPVPSKPVSIGGITPESVLAPCSPLLHAESCPSFAQSFLNESIPLSITAMAPAPLHIIPHPLHPSIQEEQTMPPPK